jgi:hypothetical protein
LQTPVTPYPAGPAEAGILRPKRRFPTGGYLRPKGCFPPGGYLRPKGRFPSYARGQPEPGKRELTLQKTQNDRPGRQEREARPSTVLHTLPHEGEDAPRPGGTGASRAEGGWQREPWTLRSNRWRNEAIYRCWAEGSPKTQRTQGTGQRWGYHVAGPGRNPSRKGNALLARGSAVRVPGGLWPSALFRGAARPKAWGGGGQFAANEDDREPQNQGRRD